MSKFCTNCGKELDSNSTVCLNCGVLQESNASNKQSNQKKKGLPVWAIVLIVVGSVLLLPLLIFLLGLLFTVNIFSKSSSTQIIQEQKKPELAVEVIHNQEFKFEKVDYDYVDVKITGSDENIKKVYLIKGIIDLNDIDNPKNGVNIIEINLKAYDMSENELNINLNPSKISVKVTLSGVVEEEIHKKEIQGIPIDVKGLGENLKVSAIGENSTHVTVSIEGTKDELAEISQENIKALVDLTGLGVGEHVVNIEITGDNNLVTYMPKTTAIKVKISES